VDGAACAGVVSFGTTAAATAPRGGTVVLAAADVRLGYGWGCL
jgi:hypothetical protein